jgi:predicted nucleotidyltransferase
VKRELALRYAHEVARRVHGVNGILATPLCDYEAVRIKRIWVFGSVAKGSEWPNDLDLLIEARECGRHRSHKPTRIDKGFLRRIGIALAPSARREALKWLTKGMRKVSRHSADEETVPIDIKILLYPRNDFARAKGRP